MKYFSREEVEQIGRSGGRLLEEEGMPPAYRYLSSYWLYVEEDDEAFTPHGPTGYWESWITVWLSQQFDDHDEFIDVGANVGYYTLMGAKHGISTTAFEPNPEVCDLLKKSLAKNRVTNTIAVPYALGAEEGRMKLNVPERHSGGAYLTDGGDTRVIPLDHFSKTLPDSILIKMDAEGFEPNIWAGMTEILATRRVTVCLEWDSQRWPNNGEGFANELFKQPFVGLLQWDGTEQQFTLPSQATSLQGLQTVIVKNY